MSRRGGNRGLPPWHKGKLILDDITGEWAGSREGKMMRQRGLNVLNRNFDTLTDKQRADNVKRRLR